MAEDLNGKYVRKDIFELTMDGINEKLDRIEKSVDSIKKNGNGSLNLKTILIIVAIATGAGGGGFAGIDKLLESFAK